MNTKTFDVIEITQPIGSFYLTKINALDLVESVNTLSRRESENGVQRERRSKRIKEIASYCEDPDATFPTALIISVNYQTKVSIKGSKLTLEYEEFFGDIIDGQHRLYGILASGRARDFELPIVLMIHPTIEEKAYIFSIINSKQEKVDKSLIYELFDVSLKRSPQKTAHIIARSLNKNCNSPFYNRLKMLGKKESEQELATLSQGTFANRLIKLISRHPDKDQRDIKRGVALAPDESLPFRQYFIADRDDVILRILLNCFGSLKDIFQEEYNSPNDYILWKSTGYNAVMDALPQIIERGRSAKDLSECFFCKIFEQLRQLLDNKKLTLTSNNFGSGEQETKKLYRYIIEALDMCE